jgi:hypothetical protein
MLKVDGLMYRANSQRNVLKSLTYYNVHAFHVFACVMQQNNHKSVMSVMSLLQTVANDSLSSSRYLNNDSCSKIPIKIFI